MTGGLWRAPDGRVIMRFDLLVYDFLLFFRVKELSTIHVSACADHKFHLRLAISIKRYILMKVW